MLTDGAELSVDQTAEPLELDQIYDSLDRLNVALGPNGANKTGALSDLLSVTADNFGGQGTTFRQTIKDFSRLSATLANNKEELFGSVKALEGFMQTLADNDQTVRQFNQSLADVSTMLAGERQELVAATQEPLGRADRGQGLRRGEPRTPGPQHHRPQPGLEGAGPPARRARRDPPRRAGSPSTTSR